MAEHALNDVMKTTMEKLRSMIDVNTIIGDSITTSDGTTIIPISKVSFGFASGGSDFDSKKESVNFGGGSGAGVTIHPEAFLVVKDGNVRLIPMDSASSGGDSSFDIQWREHTDEHLPPYTASGTLADGCRYCNLIDRFEENEFRQKGSEWLVKNHHLCTLPSGSGGHHGGGTRRGH